MVTQPQKKFRVLLVGDDCVDVYRYGSVVRISPEAPVPVFEFAREESRPGMASNVKANLEALGCAVDFFTCKPSRKIRLIDQRSYQHVLRIDEDAHSPAIRIDTQLQGVYDAIVVSDYGKGTVDYDTVARLEHEFSGPIFIDTKKTDLARFTHSTVKINEPEYQHCKSLPANLVVTLGAQGAMWCHDHQQVSYPAAAVPVNDVCGAGDTFLAALTYEFLCSENMPQAIRFAIAAGAVTVGHLGVYAPTLEEINAIAGQS